MFARLAVAAALGAAALFVVGRPVSAAETFDGQVLTAGDDHHLTIRQGDDKRTFIVNDQTSITLNGDGARWQDMKPGFKVTVKADAVGDHWIARSIAAFVDQ